MSGILVNLISSAIWLILGVLTARAVYRLRVVRPARNLWQIADIKGLIIVASHATTTHTGEYARPATGIGNIRALASVVESLNKAYGKLTVRNIYLSTDQLQDRLENDLLLLGGPKNNKISAHFLGLIKGCQPLVEVNQRFYWRTHSGRGWNEKGAQEFHGKVENDQVIKDFGIGVRMISPFTSEKRTVILIAGSHTYGVVAAAKYLTEQIHKDLPFRRLKESNLVFVVSADIMDQHPINIRLEK